MSASNQKAPNQKDSVDASSTSNPEAVESSFVSNVDNPKRRRLLVRSAALIGGFGGAALAVPMLSSMSPSARAKAAGAPVEADISKLTAGQLLTVEWRGTEKAGHGNGETVGS
jgi:Rieske Fe-S protein